MISRNSVKLQKNKVQRIIEAIAINRLFNLDKLLKDITAIIIIIFIIIFFFVVIIIFIIVIIIIVIIIIVVVGVVIIIIIIIIDFIFIVINEITGCKELCGICCLTSTFIIAYARDFHKIDLNNYANSKTFGIILMKLIVFCFCSHFRVTYSYKCGAFEN